MGTIAQCRGRDSKKADGTEDAPMPTSTDAAEVKAPEVAEEAKRPETETSQPITTVIDDDECPAAQEAETATWDSARIPLPSRVPSAQASAHRSPIEKDPRVSPSQKHVNGLFLETSPLGL